MIKSEILVPLLNANEPEARLVGVHVQDKQAVEKGTRLFTIETTKAASDVDAPASGYIRFLAREGETLLVGNRMAVITESSDEPVGFETVTKPEAAQPGTLRITRPARALAESLGLDLNTLPVAGLITEDIVRQFSAAAQRLTLPASDKPYIIVYGAGGHAKSVMEILLQNNDRTIAGIVDDDPRLTGVEVLGIPVLGTQAVLLPLIKQGATQAANGVGGILDISVRIRIFGRLEGLGFLCPSLIHPRATVEPSAKVGQGVQVFANAYVGSEATLEPKCMINTNAVVSHDCVIGAYTHIAPGALLAGHVHVGARTLVGMGVTTSIGVKIGDEVRIGNGAIILADVP